VLTVCAALPLLLLGAEVTTKKVGMVDPVGLREPWHLFTILNRALYEIGLLIEHSHRLVGFIVGTCVIVLACGLWLSEPRRWVRWLGLAALIGVCVQGLLGIFRVNLHAWMGPQLALIHGCFAQLVFATLVGLAVCTSRRWIDAGSDSAGETSPKLQRWTIITTALIYLQVVLGAFVRHTNSPLGQRGHLIVAFGVVAAIVWLMKLVFENPSAGRALVSSATLLAFFVGLQILLGVEAWMLKFSGGMAITDLRPIEPREEIVRTAHYLLGSAVFAASVAVLFQAHRQTVWSIRISPASASRMEVAV
jgi:cytochrome c oxidase assembly protein subunit 15